MSVTCQSLAIGMENRKDASIRFEKAECVKRKTHSAFDLHDMKMDESAIVADRKTKDILADAKLLEAHGLEKP